MREHFDVLSSSEIVHSSPCYKWTTRARIWIAAILRKAERVLIGPIYH